MISKDFFSALSDYEQSSGVKKEDFIAMLENAISIAYRRKYGEAKNARVEINEEKNSIKLYSYKIVVEEVENPEKEISLEDAKLIKRTYKLGDKIEKEENPKNFGRLAALTVRSVLVQNFREIEREKLKRDLATKEDKLLTVKVNRIEGENVYVDLGVNNHEAILGRRGQIPGEKYHVGQKIRIYANTVKESKAGAYIGVSRANDQFVRKLFELEVPEIANGVVKIVSIARQAGIRTKVAVYTEDKTIDPLGACVGVNSSRINAIVNELSGEKIDLILWSENPAEFVMRALSPATCISVEYSQSDNSSVAIVPDDKLSLAIGKNGHNVKLASKLTHVRIDVVSESQHGNTEHENVSNINSNEIDDSDLDNMFNDEE